jgi:hypothetical protein
MSSRGVVGITTAVFAAAAGLAFAPLALAGPRESVTFSNIESRERVNDPANITTSTTFTGGYSVGRLRVTGTLTGVIPASFASEARIRVTTPLGRTLTLQPFITSAFSGPLTINPAYELIVQPAEADAAGLWTFQFYESRNDGAGTDALWNTITIELDDAPPPPPPGDHTTALNLGEIGAGQTVTHHEPDWDFYPGVKWYRFDVPVPVTPGTSTYLDIDSNQTAYGTGNDVVTDTEIALFNQSGTLIAQDDDDGEGLASLLSFGAISSRPGGYQSQDGTLPPGTYYLCVAPFNATFASGFSVTTNSTAFPADVRVRLSSGFTSPPSAPAALDMGTLQGGGAMPPADLLAPGEIHWYTFELASPIEAALLTFFDIDTEGSLLTDPGSGTGNDTIAGLYDASGVRVLVDDDDGSGRLTQMTFGGASTTAIVGNGLAYNGRDGSLPAGRYYLAVTGFGNTAFGPTGWSVYTEHVKSGTVAVRLFTNTGAPTCPADFNGDGFLDFFDYDDYVFCFESGTCPPGRTADFNGDDFVDFFDYDDFVLNFETGC